MKKALRFLFGFLFILAGINHFINPESYLPLIPPYFPYPEFINILSGLLEVIFGAGLLFERYRRFSAFGIIAMMIAFVPAHMYHIQMDGCVSDQSCIPLWAAWARLLLIQPLLIFWAWVYTSE